MRLLLICLLTAGCLSSSPTSDEVASLTQVAGFEWGTGFYINPVTPEEAAKFLRESVLTPFCTLFRAAMSVCQESVAHFTRMGYSRTPESTVSLSSSPAAAP